MPVELSCFMEETLDNQEIRFRTSYGQSKKFKKKDESTAKYGTGQGIGWGGQACNATLDTICNAMKTKCNGMKFSSPDGTVIVETCGDYFVDDTDLGTNIMGNDEDKTLTRQAQLNDQKHLYCWFSSGGRNVVEKGYNSVQIGTPCAILSLP